ncbi:MAG TPA: hypothetical protein VGD74_00500 [Vulgatibacter sp.]
MRLPLVAAASLAAFVACDFSVPDIAEVPENPTWERDVKPLLADHCTLCHGSPPNRGAPGDFRLDVYDSPGRTVPLQGSRRGRDDDDDDRGRDRLKGAYEMADDIVDEIEDGEMPPAAAWGDGVGPNGRAMLRRWLEQGAPR